MKTLMTFAAVAALVSGVSIASAQSNMNGNLAGGAKAGAENGSFCSNINGAQTCKWNDMASCQKEAGPNGECFPSGGKASTTGAASGSMGSAKPMNAAPGNNSQIDTQKGANSMDKGAASSKGD